MQVSRELFKKILQSSPTLISHVLLKKEGALSRPRFTLTTLSEFFINTYDARRVNTYVNQFQLVPMQKNKHITVRPQVLTKFEFEKNLGLKIFHSLLQSVRTFTCGIAKGLQNLSTSTFLD